ncbi:MAG: hypothetical protein IT303_19050 [Dehalococcoidia bacterium]|nr:hypothetical protein [Dehalococcoidia bacterium]
MRGCAALTLAAAVVAVEGSGPHEASAQAPPAHAPTLTHAPASGGPDGDMVQPIAALAVAFAAMGLAVALVARDDV